MIKIDVEEYGNLDETITVGKLIALLEDLPKHEKICATWEGVNAAILKENIK